jgi:hypothetical protein
MDPQLIQSRTVIIADLNKLNVELSIKAAIDYYRTLYGEPRRVWINPKDCDDKIQEVEGFKIERRGGCCRGKVMVI